MSSDYPNLSIRHCLSYIDKSVTVKVGDAAITDGYTATYSAESKTLTVAFDNLKTTNKGENTTVAAGDVITVTYKAYITADAAVILLGAQYIRGYIWDCIFAGVHFQFQRILLCMRKIWNFIFT